MIRHDARHRHYQLSIDRIGLALAAGGAACGVIAAILLALGGRHGVAALANAFLLGTLFSTLALGAVGGPVWTVLHAAGWRGPIHAAAAGALLGFLLFLFGQVDLLPPADGPLVVGWLREIGSSLVLAAIAATIAVLMWRIAYQRAD